jgi:hypothetical protein
VPVKGLSNVKAISVGSGFACALRQAGTVACWGGNGSGQLGPDGDTSADTVVPIAGLSGVTTIATGGSFACALLSGGTVKCWGENSYGQLGNGTTDNSTTPVAVTGLSGVVAIAAFDWVACALRADGTAMCWGYSGNGGLGNGDNQGPSKCYGQVPCATTPVAVTGLSGATGISVGSHACVTLPGGNMKCWGGNWNGQLGDGTIVGSSVPVSVVK